MFKRLVEYGQWSKATTLVVFVIASAALLPRLALSEERITVLAGFGVQFAQVYVADRANLFAAEGLTVDVKLSTTGKVAVDGLVSGAGVMAVSGVFPAVSAAANAPVYIVTPVAIEDGDTKLIVRPGIDSAADLKGKRVGYTLGGDGHLFILNYLEQQGIGNSEISSANVPTEGLVSAFARGDVDAVVTWEPVASKTLETIDGAKVLAAKGVVPIYNLITMRADFIRDHPETAKKLLKGLVAAQSFIEERPDEAAKIIAEVGQLELSFVRELMDTYEYTLIIDEQFYNGIGAIADFMYEAGDLKEKHDPRDLVHSDLMKSVAPSNVK